MAGRRFGKTEVTYILAVLNAAKGKRSFFVCPTFKQCRDWYKNILKLIPKELIISENKTDLTIELATGGIIKLFSGEPDAVERMRGYESELVIVDEFCNIQNQNYVYYDIIRPLVATTGGRVFIISTPKGSANFFFQCYLKGKHNKDGWQSFKFNSLDNPFFPVEEYEQIKATTPDVTFQQEYECNPAANQTNPFKEVDIDRNTITELSTEPVFCYGVDISKGVTEGSDATVVVGLDAKGKMAYFDRWRINDYEQQYQKIKNLPYPNALKVIDSSAFSAGGVIYERLRNDGFNVIGFEFTAKSKAPMYYKLINAVEKDAVQFVVEVADEMKTFEMKFSDKSNTVFLQAQSGYHDDTIAAIAMAHLHLQRTIPADNFLARFSFL